MEQVTVQVGQTIKILWSNCAGYSIFKIKDNPEQGGIHLFELIREVEFPEEDNVHDETVV